MLRQGASNALAPLFEKASGEYEGRPGSLSNSQETIRTAAALRIWSGAFGLNISIMAIAEPSCLSSIPAYSGATGTLTSDCKRKPTANSWRDSVSNNSTSFLRKGRNHGVSYEA